MTRTYLFDFDGTLVDSMPTYIAIMTKILDDNHVPYGPELIKTITPLGLAGATLYFQQLGLKADCEETLAAMKKTILDAYWHHIPAKKNVLNVLQALRERGAELNILTASPHITMDACLKRLGMYDLFRNVWSCDDFATTKSDPAIYAMAAGKLGRPVEQVIFLDDNLDAVRTAKQAGMTAIGVYDPSSAEYEKEIRAAADGYITDFTELL